MRRGEIFGLLGPNGAGKTTTAGMLTTRVIPTSGRAFVGGIDVVAHPAAAKQVIGVVPQTNTLDRSLTRVGEPLLPRPLLRDDARTTAKAEADRLLEQFRLAERGEGAGARRCRAAWRSGSWWRGRSCTARRCCSSTSPPPGSTRRAGSRCGRSSASCTREGQTILLTTHYMEEADQLCDRLAIIDHGRLLALGTPGRAQARRPAPTPS